MSIIRKYWPSKRIASARKNPILRKLNNLAHIYVESYENLNYDFATNGERRVVEKLSTLPFKILLDVGANRGEWSKISAKYFPAATIHAFEIAPPIFEQLKANCGSQPGIVINDFGLGDKDQELEINYYPDASELTSIYNDSFEGSKLQKIKAKIIAGAQYCETAGISTIDFLKIDVEGAEMHVLKGFEKLITEKKIRVVQFEYGRNNILSRTLLIDFYKFFTEHGYKVGKIYPDYIDFSDYSFSKENFIGPNYLAIQSQDEVLSSIL